MRLALIFILALAGCNFIPPETKYYPGESDVYYFHLECNTKVYNCQDTEFRAKVHDTIQHAWTLFGEDPSKLESHWRIVFQDSLIGTNCDGLTDEGDSTITVSTQDWPGNAANPMAEDVTRSPLAHELLHYHKWLTDPHSEGDPTHSDPEWRNCDLWLNMWGFTNQETNTCVEYPGQWYGNGSGEGSMTPNGYCGWWSSPYDCYSLAL